MHSTAPSPTPTEVSSSKAETPVQRCTGDGEHKPLPVPSVCGCTPSRIGADVAICVNKVAAAPGLQLRLTQCPAAASSPSGTRVLPRVISHRQGAGTGRLCVWSPETRSERGAVLSQPCQGQPSPDPGGGAAATSLHLPSGSLATTLPSSSSEGR